MCRTHSVEEDITGNLVFSLVSVTLNTWQDITGNLVKLEELTKVHIECALKLLKV